MQRLLKKKKDFYEEIEKIDSEINEKKIKDKHRLKESKRNCIKQSSWK